MRGLRECLQDHPWPLLEGIAQWLGVTVTPQDVRQAAAEIAAYVLQPEVFITLWQRLSPQAQNACQHVLTARPPMSWHTFVRRYGPLREMGPARLQREQPWRSPQSPAEELFYRGWVFRRVFHQQGRWLELAIVPDEYSLLIPQPTTATSPSPIPNAPIPSHTVQAGDTFLEDMVTLVAFIYNEGMHVDWEGRPLRGELAQVGQRFITPLPVTELLHPPPRVHLLFHHLYTLGLVRQEGNRLHVHPRRLSRWLQQPRAYQRLTLWQAWVDSEQWPDLRQVPELECTMDEWRPTARLARKRFLTHLQSLAADRWYTIDDLIAWMFEKAPDFYRQGAEYDTWVIRRRSDGQWLRGFEHWHDVEGALIRFYLVGPMFWLDALALDEATQPTRFCLTEAGRRWLRRRSEPMRMHRPPATVTDDFLVRLPAKVHPFDRFRVARFADWVASHPQFTYRITPQSVTRAIRQGVPPRRLLAFLRRLTRHQVPSHVYRAVARWAETANTTS